MNEHFKPEAPKPRAISSRQRVMGGFFGRIFDILMRDGSDLGSLSLQVGARPQVFTLHTFIHIYDTRPPTLHTHTHNPHKTQFL